MAPLSDDPQHLYWLSRPRTVNMTPQIMAATILMQGSGYVDNQVPQPAEAPQILPPDLLLQSVLIPASKSSEGQLIEAVAIPWIEIVTELIKRPDAVFELDWRKWEEMVAAAYHTAGYDVTLTPRSNDGGRDVIATLKGVGSIRIFDQVKRYSPGTLVTAEEVRAMLGVLSAEPNVSKGFVTTTSGFAPGIYKDARLTQFMPNRLELRDRAQLLAWLAELLNAKHK